MRPAGDAGTIDVWPHVSQSRITVFVFSGCFVLVVAELPQTGHFSRTGAVSGCFTGASSSPNALMRRCGSTATAGKRRQLVERQSCEHSRGSRLARKMPGAHESRRRLLVRSFDVSNSGATTIFAPSSLSTRSRRHVAQR